MHPDTSSKHRRLYLLGRVIVARYYARPLTLPAVAKALSTSPRQLQRAYAEFDDSFHEDLLARRMRAAAQLLSEQRAIPVSDVGRLVGYRSNSHFARAFRARYKLSPAQFRERAIRHLARVQ
ncbi:MAG: helix-turn-helix transcriptional regulator [Solirubrobacteraceae bacterium]